MARQSKTPVQFPKTIRTDDCVTMTSGRAGKVVPLTFIPLLRGDSGSGRVGVDIELAEMPRPLLNGVLANVQAWFVPKSAEPRFSGLDEFMRSYQGEAFTSPGEADRAPVDFFSTQGSVPQKTALENGDFAKTLGLHFSTADYGSINMDLFDAFSLVYNFRLAAHSSRLTAARRGYASEGVAGIADLPRAFWPSGRFSSVVPDYERALVVGSLDLDVSAGQMPIPGITRLGASVDAGAQVGYDFTATSAAFSKSGDGVQFDLADATDELFAEMSGQSVTTTLAAIDSSRKTQAFAKLRTAYAGNDTTGFRQDDAIIAELMQGFKVPLDSAEPFLLDSQRVPFSMVERHATDGASLDLSSTVGRVSAQLLLNVPVTNTGGVILVTVEVVPEQIHERQSDEWMRVVDVSQYPDALRDVQRPEPVDLVTNDRLDARHTTGSGLYGYEPMNGKWIRSATRLGGAFYQDDPANPFTEQRAGIWQATVVDPEFTEDHFLVPDDFPHYVFADPLADAFECVVRHTFTISGLTQIGDVLNESNDDYAAVQAELA